MTGEPGAAGPSADGRAEGQGALGLGERERDYLLAWVGENLTLVRRFGFRAAAHVLGPRYRLPGGPGRSCRRVPAQNLVTTEPLLLVGDLIYTFGWALWTGAVVVVFVQFWPEAKRRQFQQALDAYEAAVGDPARAGSSQAPAAPGVGESGQVPPE